MFLNRVKDALEAVDRSAQTLASSNPRKAAASPATAEPAGGEEPWLILICTSRQALCKKSASDTGREQAAYSRASSVAGSLNPGRVCLVVTCKRGTGELTGLSLSQADPTETTRAQSAVSDSPIPFGVSPAHRRVTAKVDAEGFGSQIDLVLPEDRGASVGVQEPTASKDPATAVPEPSPAAGEGSADEVGPVSGEAQVRSNELAIAEAIKAAAAASGAENLAGLIPLQQIQPRLVS